MNKPRYILVVFVLTLLLFAIPGCRKEQSSQKRYDLKGKVVSVEPDKHIVTVAHDDIPDFMPAMTMPFTLRDEWAFKELTPGSQITATLVVDGTEFWLEHIAFSKVSADTNAPETGSEKEITIGEEVPDYALVNQHNKPIRLAQYRGKALLLTFIYTRCPIPDYCTLMSNNFAQIEAELAKQPELYQKTHLLSVSIDPDYDTPAVLRSYGAAHSGKFSDENFAHWEFATGTKDRIKEIAQHFGLRYYPDQDQIIHGLRTIIITPDGKVAKIYRDNTWKPEEILQELPKVVR